MNLPSVTQMIYGLGLAQGSPFFLPKHRRRGRVTHIGCHLLAQGKEIRPEWWSEYNGNPADKDDYFANEECRPHIEAYGEWWKRSAKNLLMLSSVAIELEVVSKSLGYMGHIDQIVLNLNSDIPWIIDIKNGDEEPWHPWQLGLYKLALAEHYGIIAKRANLYLPSGKFVERNDPRDLDAAKTIAKFWHLKEGMTQ